MRLWTYQHPSVLKTLQYGKRHFCFWEQVSGERWQHAFRWMAQQMIERDIPIKEHAPIWTWHSVNRIGGKPDEDCVNALMNDIQLSRGLDLLELEVPDHLVLPSCYGYWNNILDSLLTLAEPEKQDVIDCFSVQLTPRRGRPPHRFPDIQACLPYIEPAWLLSWETLDTPKIMEKRAKDTEKAKQFWAQYKSVDWEFDVKGGLLVKLTQK